MEDEDTIDVFTQQTGGLSPWVHGSCKNEWLQHRFSNIFLYIVGEKSFNISSFFEAMMRIAGNRIDYTNANQA